mmetsp:Transcript_9706/g.21723  ORF Transcript_9706/g.21723 Transcript_9706/m.21723 type:complete len:108 (-) Transcript_9706:85-408(-)|eukprot:CAMPEP_0170582066 /NCGR_PEP_ID=MMETSP0224-20130122/7380_1 /TAXON_ID=285029 /ORGANISM="Togula jolla, Strain CCCM 725" /LENGTH=107 /DNA_ID=CAMNT_0010905255 /DNA_START=83 /DNA_END=406 /DNA_ORIENTATION=+
MAFFMFSSFICSLKPQFEERVDHDFELPMLRDLWTDMEKKCFDRYIQEIDDEDRGIHVYQVLKSEITVCKQLMHHDNRREVLKECHAKVESLSRRCMKVLPTEGREE